MAKHCDVCNKSYPETEKSCPHCAAAAAESDSAVDLGAAPAVEAADSRATHKGIPPGDSDAAWAALAEDADEPAEVVSVDSPSDADILGHAATGDSSDSAPPFVAEVASSGNLPAATVSSDSGSSAEPFVAEVDSGTDLTAEAAEAAFPDEVAEVEASSSVNLEETARPAGRPSSRDLIAEAVESGVDLEAAAPEEEDATEADAAVVSEPSDSTVDLGAAAAALEQGHSSGAEAVPERKLPPGSDHDIDLDAAEAAEEAEGMEEAAVGEAEEAPAESSQVDLGGAAARPPKSRRGGSSSRLERASSGALGGGDSGSTSGVVESGIDLGPVDEDEEDEEPAAIADEDDEDEVRPKSKRAAVDEDEEEDEGRPVGKPAKARSGMGCLAIAGVLGLVIGAGASFGLWLFDIQPPDSWKMSGGKPAANTAHTGGPANTGPGAAGTPVSDPAEHLQHGDFAKAADGLKDATQPDKLAQRGEARWMQYLQTQMASGAKPNPNDQAVKDAQADLAAAPDDPEALLTLGNLQEFTGATEAAKTTYKQGADKFKDKATWARAFQAQLDRLDSAATNVKADGGQSRLHDEDRDRAARALVLLLIAFQGEANPPATGKSDTEAGFDFWAALKADRAGNYREALRLLALARKTHDERRFGRLRKAQNPLSDPTEEIFLRCADELGKYWQVKESLKDGDVPKAIAALEQQKTAATTQMKAITNKLKTTPDKAAASIDALVKEKDDALKMAKQLDADLISAKKDLDIAKKEVDDLAMKMVAADKKTQEAGTKLKGVGDRLAAAGVKDADFSKGVDALAAERAAADKTIAAVVDKLALVNIKVAKKDVLPGVDRVVETAQIVDPKGELMASRDELRRLGGILGKRRTPQEMLDVWLNVLADRAHKDAVAKAIVDVDRVLADDASTADAKRKAAAVLGLAQRNKGDFKDARTSLTDAVAGPGPKAEWQLPVAAALKELTDPTAYYLPHARSLFEEGKYKETLAVVDQGSKLFAEKDAAVLLPVGGLAHLALSRTEDKAGHKTAAFTLAEKAAAAGNPEGFFVVGLIAEYSGDLKGAKQAYNKALELHRDHDEAGARYRLALARVLKLESLKPAGAGAALDLPKWPVAQSPREALTGLLMLVEIGFQPGGREQDKIDTLLDEVLNTKDGPDTFLLKSQALALRGLWTPALKVYAAGLRPHVRRDYAEVLTFLVEGNPVLRRPSTMDPPNPLLAETSYSSGLRYYFARRYADAESAFAKAIEYDNQDARYFYFLGLSRLAQNKQTDADADFRAGAQLELQNRPGREAVSAALERVQGSARQTVNRVRP